MAPTATAGRNSLRNFCRDQSEVNVDDVIKKPSGFRGPPGLVTSSAMRALAQRRRTLGPGAESRLIPVAVNEEGDVPARLFCTPPSSSVDQKNARQQGRELSGNASVCPRSSPIFHPCWATAIGRMRETCKAASDTNRKARQNMQYRRRYVCPPPMRVSFSRNPRRPNKPAAMLAPIVRHGR
jgi:hypothetical protein